MTSAANISGAMFAIRKAVIVRLLAFPALRAMPSISFGDRALAARAQDFLGQLFLGGLLDDAFRSGRE